MTDQPINPLVPAGGGRGRGGKVTKEMLYEMVERSNRMRWVIESGQPYFVNRKWEEGSDGIFGRWVHFLDRHAP